MAVENALVSVVIPLYNGPVRAQRKVGRDRL